MRQTSVFKLSLKQKRVLGGYVFVLPFVVGFVLFILYPLIQSIRFSISEVVLTPDGFTLEYTGLENYRYAILKHTTYVRSLTETVAQTLRDVPLVLVFSFFAACLLNQQFKGRMLARVIFFLPVIMGAGAVAELEELNYAMSLVEVGGTGDQVGFGSALIAFLESLRLPEFFIQYVVFAIVNVAEVIKSSGIQILIFLAGLQSVPPALYEAADVEGSTGWERFWLITLPMMSPLILTNIVYTVIDSFTSSSNTVLRLVRSMILTSAGYGASSAMAWMYFAIIAVMLAIVVGIVSRHVFYEK